MRIAVGSDEATAVTTAVVDYLRAAGHDVVAEGPLAGKPEGWAQVALKVARRVSHGDCDQGVLFCWTGTGVCMAANKVPGVRAALCADAETARGARLWNDANVLCLSLRATSEAVAREVLDAWFAAGEPDPSERENLALLAEADATRSTG